MNIFRTKNNVNTYISNNSMEANYGIYISNSEATLSIPWDFSTSSICIFGVMHTLRLYYRHVKTSTINLINSTIEAILPNKFKKLETSQIIKILMQKIYDKIAEQEIEMAMEKTRLLLGIAPEDYSINRLENHQMGICFTDKKRIIISPDVVKYDRKTIEYIVLHEFCHLKYKTHAKGFWNMVAKYMPDYEKYITKTRNVEI